MHDPEPEYRLLDPRDLVCDHCCTFNFIRLTELPRVSLETCQRSDNSPRQAQRVYRHLDTLRAFLDRGVWGLRSCHRTAVQAEAAAITGRVTLPYM